jgi:hypothetical protein
MKKLLCVVTLFALGTACPKVEKKTYRFDMKQRSGTLTFQNIFTDEPEKSDKDFMQLVENVVEGQSVEEDHPGWKISAKTLFDHEGRLDGLVTFEFEDASAAGLFKHDKKSPYIWCASQEDNEKVSQTNGDQIMELPGCVVWDRKTSEMWVTVDLEEPEEDDKSLLDSWSRWSKGEKLDAGTDGMPSLGDLSSADGLEGLAAGMMQGLTQNMISGEIVVGPLTPTGAEASDVAGALTDLVKTQLQWCAMQTQTEAQPFEDTVALAVKPDGTFEVTVPESSAPHPARVECVQTALAMVQFPAQDSPWTATFTLTSSGASIKMDVGLGDE